jgi:Copper transport outer membrane protein, MctB
VIDFRYHLVSIVAVFLALAIGIVLGSTELQGSTIDGLRSLSNSLNSKLSAVSAQRDGFEQEVSASDAFLQTAEPKLLNAMLAGDKIVLITEPGAPSTVIDGIEKAAGAGYAGATVTGTIALQPKFNDLSGATRSSLYAINADLATTNGAVLAPATAQQTVYQQEAAQLIATAILNQVDGETGLTAGEAQTLLGAYAKSGYLTTSGAPWDRATLAVIVTPQTAPADGPNDPANQVLLATAAQFATASAATLVAGPVTSSAASASAISVLRGSSVSSQVSSVDNADTQLGQISTIWALADQLAGGKPNSYGISGASAVSPVPLPVPSVTPTVSGTPTPKATGKVKKTVNTK